MVYLVGGYILTFEQVLAFVDHNKFEEPCIDAITLCGRLVSFMSDSHHFSQSSSFLETGMVFLDSPDGICNDESMTSCFLQGENGMNTSIGLIFEDTA
jgi:hypothetical protein